MENCPQKSEDGGKVIHAWDRIRIDRFSDVEKLSSFGEHPKYLGWVPLERVLAEKPLL